MTVSYQDLINLANVLELDNPTSQQKYNVKFADRSGGDFNPQVYNPQVVDSTQEKDDLHVLLNALVGKINTGWVGSNCSYTEGNCERVGSGLQKIVTPTSPAPYSKCNFGNDGAGAYIPSGDLQQQWDCPDLQSCPTDSAYYWKVEPDLKEVRANNSAYLGSLKDISQPGRCEQRYLGNEDNNKTTNDPNDPNCNRYESGDGNGSGCIPVGVESNAWECRPYGDIMRHTAFPNAGAGAPYKIKKNRNAANAIEDDGSIQHACASNHIRYGGGFSASTNKFDPTFDGQTDPDWNLLYTENAADGNENIVESGETRDCKIRATYAKYVRKNNYSQECDPSMPLYPGSTAAATYDIPLTTEYVDDKDWWKKNSCIWVNSLPFDADLNANWVGFEPQILNGDCGYDDFVAKDADGVYRTIDSGSATNMPSSGADIASTEDGCFGQVTQEGDQEVCHPINALIDHNTLKRIADAQVLQGIPLDSDLWPGIGHPSHSDTTFNETANCETIDHECAWIKGNVPQNIVQNAASVSGNYIGSATNGENTDANDTTGKYKIYARDDTQNRRYKHPCYKTIGDKKYYLEKDKYRGVKIQDVRPAVCGASPGIPQQMKFDKTIDDGYGPGWYTSESDGHINVDARGDLNTLKEAPQVAGQSEVRLINDLNIHNETDGNGAGETWTKVRIQKYPQYVNTSGEGILDMGFQHNEDIINDLDSKFNSGNRMNIIQELARGEGDNGRIFYYKSPPSELLPAEVDAVAQVEYAWVNEN
tara:strand:- start:16018 stop:18300 length:2283 start_codon:yes stop_codon:yes gene_type:complete